MKLGPGNESKFLSILLHLWFKRLSESLPIIDSIHSVLFVGRDLAMIEL